MMNDGGNSEAVRLSLTRREAVRRMVAAAATITFLDQAFGVSGLPSGILSDPDLHKKVIPWERVLTEREVETVTALCDLIIPADDKSPAASAVGVPDFINEWVSAPYPQQVSDREQVRAGLVWIDEESAARFGGRRFAQLGSLEKQKICDDICNTAKAGDAQKKGAEFFSKMRNLTAGGFYTTPEGTKDLGYIGNVPLAEFPGPPPEVLKHLGLA
jgi:hypothetical protein